MRDDGGTWLRMRLDHDGERIVGGWSAAHLNVDGARRADNEQVKTGHPDDMDVAVWNAEEAASHAASWFHSVIDAHLEESPQRGVTVLLAF